jgi:hypothetical protein
MIARLAFVTAAACLLGLVAPAAAQDKGAARQACVGDFKKLCAGVARGGGRIKKCLTDNLDKLTPECRAAVTALGAKKNKS